MSPLFNWKPERSAGMWMHLTCLPNAYGVGTMGREAYDFVDFLAESGLRYWQVCPLGPTGFGDSPYQSFSAFAGNPYMIDLRECVGEADLECLRGLRKDRVDYGQLFRCHAEVLKQVDIRDTEAFTRFKHEHGYWLEDFAHFWALKLANGHRPWWEWTVDKPDALLVEHVRYVQYLFGTQWQRLRGYANEKGISIIGDIPLFVSLDSADVWAKRHLFQLDENGMPRRVAGVPPGRHSEEGQLWGNPLFDWEAHRDEGYRWWMERIKANAEMFDVLRLDHFRGYASYWSIPANAKSAKDGCWEAGPRLEFFEVIKREFPDIKIVIEDLGQVTEDVSDLMKSVGLPHMGVLQFAFDGNPNNPYLLENLHENMVIYASTHDTNTSAGWYGSIDSGTRGRADTYLGLNGLPVERELIESIYGSKCRLAITMIQDLLGLGSEGRFNTPSIESGNWSWRMTDEMFDSARNSCDYLKGLKQKYNR